MQFIQLLKLKSSVFDHRHLGIFTSSSIHQVSPHKGRHLMVEPGILKLVPGFSTFYKRLLFTYTLVRVNTFTTYPLKPGRLSWVEPIGYLGL